MDTDAEVRFKIPRELHLRWNSCAEARGLSLRAFVVATVSAYLVGTGELDLPKGVTKTTKASEPITKVTRPAPAYGLSVWGDEEEEFNVGD